MNKRDDPDNRDLVTDFGRTLLEGFVLIGVLAILGYYLLPTS